MKYAKTLAVSVAAMALLAFAGVGTASATVLSTSAGNLGVGANLDFSLKSGTSAELKTTNGTVLDTCTGSTIKGSISNAGGSGLPVKGSVEKANLTWTGCTFVTATTNGGELEVEWTKETKGTVKAKNFKVTVNGTLGDCVYTIGTTPKVLGELKGGNPAEIAIEVGVTEETGFCPASEVWKATYVSTEPAGTLDVTKE